jgi:hypothetical protein
MAAVFRTLFRGASGPVSCSSEIWGKHMAEIPLILTLDFHGVPHRWVTWQQSCYY